MTDSFTSSHIATATTAATNQLSHKPTVAADPFGMLLCVVNVGWTDAEEKQKKKQQKKSKLVPAEWQRLASETNPLHFSAITNRKRWKTPGRILCCQCIVDRRKSVRTATLWHKTLPTLIPLCLYLSVSPSSSASSSRSSPSLPSDPSSTTSQTPPLTCAFVNVTL